MDLQLGTFAVAVNEAMKQTFGDFSAHNVQVCFKDFTAVNALCLQSLFNFVFSVLFKDTTSVDLSIVKEENAQTGPRAKSLLDRLDQLGGSFAANNDDDDCQIVEVVDTSDNSD